MQRVITEPPPAELWDTQRLADWLRISRNAVLIMMSRSDDRPRGRKVGREWRFDPRDIQDWWEERLR